MFKFTSIVCFFLNIVFALYSVYRNPKVIPSLCWSLWTASQYFTVYYVVGDFMMLGCFWYVCRTHVKMVIKQVADEVDDLINVFRNKNVSKKKLDFVITTWHQRYMESQRILINFDSFSKDFLFHVILSSSPFCAGCLFGGLKSNDYFVSVGLYLVTVSFAANTLIVLSASTDINKNGKIVYEKVTRLVAEATKFREIGLFQRILLKRALEDIGNQRYPSISLTTLSGTPYDSMAFMDYILSFILLFLMFFDFLHQVL